MGEAAPAEAVTGIVSAGVTVITKDRGADAGFLCAVVANSAGIAVFALTPGYCAVAATRFPVAEIVSTFVSIVTELDEHAALQAGLIHVAVTVVVEAVTTLLRRCRGVARRQAVGGADAQAVANATGVLYLTGSTEGELDGAAGARAITGVGHALLRLDAVDCAAVGTGKPPGTVTIGLATATAEATSGAIGDANVVSTANGLAVGSHCARFAEVGVVRDADEDDVRLGARYFLA